MALTSLTQGSERKELVLWPAWPCGELTGVFTSCSLHQLLAATTSSPQTSSAFSCHRRQAVPDWDSSPLPWGGGTWCRPPLFWLLSSCSLSLIPIPFQEGPQDHPHLPLQLLTLGSFLLICKHTLLYLY